MAKVTPKREAESTPFDGLLPPGWSAAPVKGVPDTYLIRNGVSQMILEAKIDRYIPLDDNVRYVWRRFIDPDGHTVRRSRNVLCLALWRVWRYYQAMLRLRF